MKTDDLDFNLPAELIAQTPSAERAASRLLYYSRADGRIDDITFSDLPGLLRPGDLMVFNDARVIPARFVLRKPTGGRIEGLFLHEPAAGQWQVLLKNLADAGPGMALHFDSEPQITARVLENLGVGEFRLQISPNEPAMQLLGRLGRMPLPTYIKREKNADPRDELDRVRYQTVYASQDRAGAIAAPTAGLHFTPELLAKLDKMGVQRANLTLDVGIGTFKPVSATDLQDHRMHSERYTFPQSAAGALNLAKQENRRIIAVGTTSARVLESQPTSVPFIKKRDQTSIFIYPPYQWKHVSGLITNFHLPRSTLIALVAALVGIDEQRRIYSHAIAQKYRFFSYGDAMLID
jgi:S-adenosylmethionine:tRNA ribosyltransferase-isomerase